MKASRPATPPRAAQISDQRQPWTGASSRRQSRRALRIEARAERERQRKRGRPPPDRPGSSPGGTGASGIALMMATVSDRLDARSSAGRDHQIAVARDIDQRRFRHRRGRRDHLGGEQEGRARRCRRRSSGRPGPSPPCRECRARARSPICAAMIQKPTWRTCRATAALSPSASFWVITGAEDRIEAGLQLLRQRGDLLRDIIDADIAGAKNRPRMAMSSRREPHSIASARGERDVAPRDRHQRAPDAASSRCGRP